MFKDLTLITCSYGTPEITTTMLKSFVSVHGDGPHNLLLMENSTNEDTVKLLKDNNIGYIRNAGFTHSEGVDLALGMCKTRYALLVDTDIIFEEKIDGLVDMLVKSGATLMGTICGDRAGYKLKPRVHPWFCFINVDNIKKCNIRFHVKNDDRLWKTNSMGFYQNIPLNGSPDNLFEYYDVGATFFEDVSRAGLKTFNVNGIEKVYTHYEGSSWKKLAGDVGNRVQHHKTMMEYRKVYEKYLTVDISNKFILR